MGFFSDLFGTASTPKESPAEIERKINTSATSERFKNYFLENLSQDSEWCKYLLQDTKKHNINLEFAKQGVSIEFLNYNQSFYKANGTYVYNRINIGFSASGFTDLPNNDYVYAFKKYIVKALQENCSYLDVRNDGFIGYKESAKTGW